MSVQLILGGSGSGKSYQLYKNIIHNSLEDVNSNHLVIVPEQFTLQTQKDIISVHPNKGVLNVDILSFLRFALRVFDEIGGNISPILDDTGKNMIIRKVIEENKKDLIFFSNNTKKMGFINELKSILSEFYQYSVRVEDVDRMKEVAVNKPILRAKLNDITKIYQAFNQYIQDQYITAEEILEVLYKVMDDSKWIKESTIYLDGFTGFTPIQYKVLTKLMKHAKDVYITLTIDPREDIFGNILDYNLFAISQKTIVKLRKIAAETDTEFKEVIYAEHYYSQKYNYRFNNARPLAFLEKNIFRYPYEQYKKEQDQIKIFEMQKNMDEVEFVAKEIKKLVRENGHRYKDIAIVSADIEQYAFLIHRVFSQNKIPCFVDYKRPILHNPLVQLIRSLLNIIVENFNYESVFRYLRTGLSNLSRDEIDDLENFVIAKGIRGYNRYSEPFDKAYRSNTKVDLEYMNAIRLKFINEVEESYIQLKNKENKVKDYVFCLFQHGIKLEVENKLTEQAEYFKENHMPIEAKEYEQIYDTMIDLYEQINLLLGEEMATPREFADILEEGLLEAKVGVIPPGVDEVVVGDTQRTRLKDVKTLFFIGVNDGIVPMTNGGGGILSDMDRELLIKNDFDLAPTTRQKTFIDQLYIYINLTKPSERLYLTYHSLNQEGKTARPSYLINKILQIFDGMEICTKSEEDLNDILNDEGLNYLAIGLRDYPNRDLSDLWKEVYLFYLESDDRKLILEQLIQGKFERSMDYSLNRNVAKLLYGQELIGSVTRFEQYEACSFAHFLTYGLQLEERPEFKLAIPDIGNIFHNAIDDFSKKLDSSKYTWHNIPDDIREDWAYQSVYDAVENYENSFIRSSKRNEYLIERIKRITVRTLWALCNQIRQGSFEPSGYEVLFNHKFEEENLVLRGRVDRLDIYEEGNNIYVRVIDYKSGSMDFDFNKVYYGLQQQLVTYLNAIMSIISKENPDKSVIPAGILYYNIDDPIVDKTEDYIEDIFKKLKMSGLVNQEMQVLAAMDHSLVNEDGSFKPSIKSNIIPVATNKEGGLTKTSKVAIGNEIGNIIDYVSQKLKNSSKEILEGKIELNPYELKKTTACDYCQYRAICGFDLRLPEHHYRTIGNEDLEMIKNELLGRKNGGESNEMD